MGVSSGQSGGTWAGQQKHQLAEGGKSSVGGFRHAPREGDWALHCWKGKGRSVLLMENALGFLERAAK